MKHVIQATNAVVRKGKTPVLSLSVAVPKGKVVGLIGPSGSGKTTFMRAIIGAQSLYSGSVLVLGKQAGAKELRRSIGYMSQQLSVYQDMTVAENLRYFADVTSASNNNVTSLLRRVQLYDFRNRLVQGMSGGQKARVSLAIALLGDPDILILDEPTVGLDPMLRIDLWKLFRELADSGKTLIISSHVMDEAEQCDELIMLRDGHLVWDGPRSDLLERTHSTSVGDAFVALINEKAGIA